MINNNNCPSEKIFKTINLAAHLHRDQHRHDENKTPYVSHLYAVASIVSSTTDDEDVICAALMHDSLEDVADYNYDRLESDCGSVVAKYVQELTEDKSLPYKERKLKYIDSIRNGSLESVMISVADKIHNAKSYTSLPDDKKHDGHELLYSGILEIAIERLGAEHLLVVELRKIIAETFAI